VPGPERHRAPRGPKPVLAGPAVGDAARARVCPAPASMGTALQAVERRERTCRHEGGL